jgi:hypothetical protein
MSRSSLRRLIFALAVGAVLLMPGLAAARPRGTFEHRQLPHILATPMEVMARLWNLVIPVLTKTGCLIDPHGGCTDSTPTVDTGCDIDPHGGCGS